MLLASEPPPMKAHHVSRVVNSPRNNTAELLRPAEQSTGWRSALPLVASCAASKGGMP